MSSLAGLWVTALYSPNPCHNAHTVALSRFAPSRSGCTRFHGWAAARRRYPQRCSAPFHHIQIRHDIPGISACPAWVPPDRCRRGIRRTVFGAWCVLTLETGRRSHFRAGWLYPSVRHQLFYIMVSNVCTFNSVFQSIIPALMHLFRK